MSELIKQAPNVEYQGNGGARPGSGPKPSLEKQLAKAEKVAKELRLGTKLGLHRLAYKYDDLMKTAIEIATGQKEALTPEGKQTVEDLVVVNPKTGESFKPGPDKDMIKFLLNLPVKLVEGDEDTGANSGIARIIQRAQAAGAPITITQNNFRPDLSGSDGGNADTDWGPAVPRAVGDSSST